jgi:hypothetical protein
MDAPHGCTWPVAARPAAVGGQQMTMTPKTVELEL